MGSRKIITIVPVAFLVYLFGTAENGKSVTLPDSKHLLAWVSIFFVLIILTDFGQTEEIATALAFLVLLSVLLAYGVPAFVRLSGNVGVNTEGSSNPKGGPGGESPSIPNHSSV